MAGEKEAQKLDRAPTLVVATAALTGELAMDEEDVCATAAAITLVLLAATERDIATYWRTPQVLRTKVGREAVGIPAGERFLGLLHFGTAAREPAAREREPARVLRGVPALARRRSRRTPAASGVRLRLAEIEVLVTERRDQGAEDRTDPVDPPVRPGA